ncbi:MAG: anti-sigma factor [Bacteroidia bacterium]|nr:anti-sigma factor [Bacteroidia bacterium]MDW8300907.1 anti-sigma factor [Bacteroidia bacterium]
MKTVQEIIDSGVLEEYVLGLLSEAESREVEQYMLQYPEIQNIVFELQESLFQYSLQYQKTPNPALKEKILSKIYQIEDKNSEPKRIVLPLLYVLSLIAGVFAITFAILWQNEVKNSKNLHKQVAQLRDEHRNCESKYKDLKKNYESLITSDKGYRAVAKLCNSKTNLCLATIYWDYASKQAYYRIEAFPALPDNKVYRLWYIANKKPIDAGILKNTQKDSGLKSIELMHRDVEAFAVTLEEKAGEYRASPPRPEEIFIYTPITQENKK